MSKQISVFTQPLLYNDDGFLHWLVRLQPFHSETGNPPMTANQFYWGARLQMECGLRISELLNSLKEHWDLDHRILTLINPKTAKGSKQYTTILPYSIKKLEKFLDKFKDKERPFPTTRSTMAKYYKNTSTIAGMNIYAIRESQSIEGAFTHMMRNSCARMYEDKGAKPALINKKLRWKPESMLQRYTRVEITDVLDFDEIHFSVEVEP